MQALDEINRSLPTLPEKRQLAFGLAVSESLFPAYQAFASKAQWGDPAGLRLILDELKAIASSPGSGSTIDGAASQLPQWNAALDEATPDMDDFPGSLRASLALDVCSMIGECLDFLGSQDTEHIRNVAYIAVQALSAYAASQLQLQGNEPDFDEITAESTAVQAQLRFQAGLLRSLGTTEAVRAQWLEEALEGYEGLELGGAGFGGAL